MVSAAQNLLVSICLVLLVALPIMGWVIGREYKELSARIWFSAIALDAITILLIAFKQLIGETLSEVAAHTLVTLIYLLMGAALNLERRGASVPIQKIGSIVFLFALIQTCLIWLDSSRFYSAVWINLAYIMLSIYLSWLTFSLARETENINLRFVLIGWLIGLSGYLWRVVETIILGERILIFSLTPVSNWIIISNILTIILISFGYLGYMQDKLVRSKLDLAVKAEHAEVQRQLAEKHANDLGEIIRERDHMVMVNSRFQALGGLALFNSAIIHEISQPLSGLTLSLQMLAHQIENDPKLANQTVMKSIEMKEEISRIVSTLRGLMQQGTIENQCLDVAEVIHEILPVIRTECQLKKIKFETSIAAGGIYVVANVSLLQRVIINLAANAIDAMENTSSPRLTIETETEKVEKSTSLILRVRDNGKGMTDEQLSSLFRPFASHKQDGTGVGLALSQILVMRWGGEIVATRASKNGSTGMLFEIRLPAKYSSNLA